MEDDISAFASAGRGRGRGGVPVLPSGLLVSLAYLGESIIIFLHIIVLLYCL